MKTRDGFDQPQDMWNRTPLVDTCRSCVRVTGAVFRKAEYAITSHIVLKMKMRETSAQQNPPSILRTSVNLFPKNDNQPSQTRKLKLRTNGRTGVVPVHLNFNFTSLVSSRARLLGITLKNFPK